MNYGYGNKYIRVPNEPDGLVINFYVKMRCPPARITIADAAGRVVRRIDGRRPAQSCAWTAGGQGLLRPTATIDHAGRRPGRGRNRARGRRTAAKVSLTWDRRRVTLLHE
jgi:hypothetical protein